MSVTKLKLFQLFQLFTSIHNEIGVVACALERTVVLVHTPPKHRIFPRSQLIPNILKYVYINYNNYSIGGLVSLSHLGH